MGSIPFSSTITKNPLFIGPNRQYEERREEKQRIHHINFGQDRNAILVAFRRSIIAYELKSQWQIA